MRIRRWSTAVLALALVATACGNGDDGADSDLEDPADVVGDDQDLDIEGGDDESAGDTDTGGQAAAGGNLLETVRSRGSVLCGVNDAVPGFGVLNEDGDYEGFDIDFCRVIAAAVLGDAEAVDYVPLNAEARFTALQSGEIDVLSRNTTWTATRDGSEGASFTQTTFFDGQGMMVRGDSGITGVDDMDNTVVCVLSGTTTEMNLESQFSARGLTYEGLTFEDNDTLQEAFSADRCDGWTSDKSQLAAVRSAWPDGEGGPDSLVILDDTLSKEPLGPATIDNDSSWFDAVNWAIIATIQAEEFGITSENVEQFVADTDPETDPEVARFLGLDGTDVGLELDAEFAQNIISQVGNYGEIFDRHIGPETSLGLDRNENALWTDGGLLYPMPFR